jgi:hypothetical protein
MPWSGVSDAPAESETLPWQRSYRFEKLGRWTITRKLQQ